MTGGHRPLVGLPTHEPNVADACACAVGRRAQEHRDGSGGDRRACEGKCRWARVIDRDHDDDVRVPPSTSHVPATSASRPACNPPPTEKLGPVRWKAIEHSPATAFGDV